MRSGNSGALERDSIRKKEAISTAEALSRLIVSTVPQPCWVARVIP
jgi:hypothetical protein